MHNGSVPNLYEMLIPAKERTKKFYLGREFDPVKVGLDTSGASGKFLVDTALRGNSNAGHSFENGPRGNGVIGPLLTDDQRWALVEYLKSIPEEPGRVTPFGGPEGACLRSRNVSDQGMSALVVAIGDEFRRVTAEHAMSDHIDGPRQIGDPSADITDLFAFTSPENPARTVLAANVFPTCGIDAIFSNAIDHAIVVRRVTVAGLGRRHQIRDQRSRDPLQLSVRRARTQRGRQKPIQRGTCTLPGGQTLRFVVNDEKGASTPDGTFRVFAGLRSDPFILAWLARAGAMKPFQNLLATTTCFASSSTSIPGACSTPPRARCSAVIAETVPLPSKGAFVGHEPPRIDWVGRPEQTNVRLNNRGLKGVDDLRDLWNQQTPFAIAEKLRPLFFASA